MSIANSIVLMTRMSWRIGEKLERGALCVLGRCYSSGESYKRSNVMSQETLPKGCELPSTMPQPLSQPCTTLQPPLFHLSLSSIPTSFLLRHIDILMRLHPLHSPKPLLPLIENGVNTYTSVSKDLANLSRSRKNHPSAEYLPRHPSRYLPSTESHHTAIRPHIPQTQSPPFESQTTSLQSQSLRPEDLLPSPQSGIPIPAASHRTSRPGSDCRSLYTGRQIPTRVSYQCRLWQCCRVAGSICRLRSPTRIGTARILSKSRWVRSAAATRTVQ